MLGETYMNKKTQFIWEYLTQLFPEAKTELNFRNEFELLVAVVLSAQCTDKRVNAVTKVLFDNYPDAKSLSMASQEDIEKIIYSTGFFKNKAKNIINLSKMIIKSYNGNVPSTVEELVNLPGVGRKTANVVYSNFFGGNAIAVDTHVYRVSRRLGLSNATTADKVEQDLMRRFDEHMWTQLHSRLVLFGRYYCKSRSPRCDVCGLKDVCKYYKNLNKKERD